MENSMSEITLYHGDCLVEMNKIVDKSVDMILCDLPYGTLNFKQDGWVNNNSDISWDNEIDIDKLFLHYKRIIKQNGAIILFCKEPLTSKLVLNDLLEYSHKYIWIKNNCANPKLKNKSNCSYTEEIVVLYDKYNKGSEYDLYRNDLLKYINKSRKEIIDMCGNSVDHIFRNKTKQFVSEYGYNQLIKKFHINEWENFIPYNKLCDMIPRRTFNNNNEIISDLLYFNKDKDNVHPTQKPHKLLEFLINLYSNENEIILDNCMGSGSCGVACVNTNRNFIGIEKDEKYFEIAKDRINKVKESLFDI